MKIGIGHIIILVILFSALGRAQEKSADTTHSLADSAKISNAPVSTFGDFEIYRKLYFMKNKVTPDGDPGTIWLWTSASISNSNFAQSSSDQNIDDALSPFHRLYLEQSKFNPVRYFLGMAQTTAAGYLAYKAIKKYGFWKRK